MTITGIRKIKETGSNQGGQFTVNEEYQVDFTGEFDVSALLIAGGTTVGGITLPSYGDEHENITTIYALDISADREENSGATNGVGVYRVVFKPNQFEQQDINPLDRDPEIQWRGSDATEVVFKDFDDVYFKNSAGDQYDVPPERPVQGCSECVISFNTTTNPANWCTNFSNTVYSGSLWGVPARKILMGVIEAQKVTEKYRSTDITYWRVSVPLRFNVNGWNLKVIDVGFKYLNGSGQRVPIRDAEGTTETTPFKLNGSGAVLAAAADPVIYPTNGYKIFPDSTWSGLLSNLTNPFS